MKLHHLKPAEGAKRDRTRVGRGRAGTRGKTAGRGTKGWGARHNPKPGFEGGQMPLQRRVPKLKGFTNPNRVPYAVVNVGSLGEVFDREVDPKALLEHGLVRKGRPVKILARGEIDKALTVRAHAFSASVRMLMSTTGTGTWDPNRYTAMMARVNRILFRRSGTLNALTKARSTGPYPTPGRPGPRPCRRLLRSSPWPPR